MKNLLLPFLVVFLIACQSNQTDSSTNTRATNIVQTDKTEATTRDETINNKAVEQEVKIVKLATPETAYVTAQSGLRVRKSPSLEGERIGVRPYTKKVLITHKTGIPLSVQDDGKTITGEWVGIESRLVTQGKVELVTGYIFSGFLTKEQDKSASVNLAHFNGIQQGQGIGGIILEAEKLPLRPNNFKLAPNDSLRFYKDDLKTVSSIASHWFLLYGGKRYLSPDKKDCPFDSTSKRMSFSSELGLGNFPYVKEIKGDFALLGFVCGEAVWVKLNELPDFAKFQSHLEIFQGQPNGGGWEKGYTYLGTNNVLREAPDLNAKAIVNKILPDYEIHLLGPVKNNWAKVKVKQAKHIFGEMYYEKSIYSKTWEGWIMLVEPDGMPLMEPHIFGC